MSRDTQLKRTAERAGLITRWRDAFGTEHSVSPDTLRALLTSMSIDSGAEADTVLPNLIVTSAARPQIHLPSTKPARVQLTLEHGGTIEAQLETSGRVRLRRTLPPGYHRLAVGNRQWIVAAAPERCFGVADALGGDGKLFGIAAQLYALRRRDDGGYGDFAALSQLIASAAEHAVAAIALSPTHAMFAGDATKYSPYSPSHRAFLNTLYADVDSSSRIAPKTTHQRQRDNRASASLIDWPGSAVLHRTLLEEAFQRFNAGRVAGAADFDAFRRRSGAPLDHHALFEALDERDARRAKPAVSSRAATTFAASNSERIFFHRFAQWMAARGLNAAQASARARGMPIGLIADFAVGVDPRGSECWSQPQNMLIGAAIGAPPDALNAIGQNWGLTTYSPVALQREGFAPFLDVLRAVMRHAGGVRLDHVMSLMRLWMIPAGAEATQGAYLRYPFDDLVRLVALESWRHRCIVIGEDLGTVPDDCRTRLAQVGILGLDVLPFMRDNTSFIKPDRWRDNAVAMTSTHDVATVAGWWRGRDLDWRRRLRLFGERGEKIERADRDMGKSELAKAVKRAHVAVLPERSTPSNVVDAAVGYVAATASPLAIVPLEDIVGDVEQPNLPGTIAEHPNWRRRYRSDASTMLDTPDAARRLRILAHQRKSIE